MRDSVGKAYLMATITIYGIKNCGQTQLSALIPGMRPNSRILLVTTINPSLRA